MNEAIKQVQQALSRNVSEIEVTLIAKKAREEKAESDSLTGMAHDLKRELRQEMNEAIKQVQQALSRNVSEIEVTLIAKKAREEKAESDSLTGMAHDLKRELRQEMNE